MVEKQNNSFDNIEIEEDTNIGFTSGKDKRNFKSIIMEHYNNCIKEGSKEMTSGGVMRRLINDQVLEVVVPNQIMIFIHHVEMLKRAMCAEIPKFEDIVIKANRFEDKRLKLNKDFKDKKNQIRQILKSTSTNINQESGYCERDIAIDNSKKIIKALNERYNNLLLDLYQEVLFPLLTELLAKMNYFEEEGVVI